MKPPAIACAVLLLVASCEGGSPGTAGSQPAPLAVVAVTTPATTPPPATTTPAISSVALSPPAASGPCGRTAAAPAGYDHVIWIWMENKDSNAVADPTAAPFIHDISTLCGSASHYVDNGIHPSLPNYIAATSGDPQGVVDDDPPADHPLPMDNIFRQVRALGKRAKSYQEDMPTNCALESTDNYKVKHNPAAYYVGEDDRAACLRDNTSFDEFASDLQQGLPDFSLITPNICNDMHDCSVATGDAWLRTVVTEITSSAAYDEGRTAVFIVFDESEGAGTMPFVAVAPSIEPGTLAAAELNHFSLLAFTEDALGVTTRLGGALGATSLAAAFGL